ncbi:MAG: UDP-N-acetylmuramate dehydrogenase [Patescibacteria group bacterium]|nr:UDP-N-acetylmuramate dehydrogenase [Patescibacteria group bacterium]
MEIKSGISLAPYTTFKIGGKAKWFCVAESLDDLKEAIKFAADRGEQIFVFGGGSNILVSDKGFGGLAVKIEFKGMGIISDGNGSVTYQVAAGEYWDGFVQKTVDENLWGVENLSHIPGNVGGVAVQNAGAYGQEASQVIEQVTAFDILTGEIKKIANKDCKFGYRSSIFNNREKGRYVILSVKFKLSKTDKPNLSYRDLAKLFAGRQPAAAEIRQAIIKIRDKKFPYPSEAANGNAGSFFKNIVLDAETYGCVENIIKDRFGEEILGNMKKKVFHEPGGCLKIPAAFLLDICGLKDIRTGNAAINPGQPLVILNKTGQASAEEILGVAAIVRGKVFEKTGLKLCHEPELVGFSKAELEKLEN